MKSNFLKIKWSKEVVDPTILLSEIAWTSYLEFLGINMPRKRNLKTHSLNDLSFFFHQPVPVQIIHSYTSFLSISPRFTYDNVNKIHSTYKSKPTHLLYYMKYSHNIFQIYTLTTRKDDGVIQVEDNVLISFSACILMCMAVYYFTPLMNI